MRFERRGLWLGAFAASRGPGVVSVVIAALAAGCGPHARDVQPAAAADPAAARGVPAATARGAADAASALMTAPVIQIAHGVRLISWSHL
jgi:hypothetical protein